MGQHPIERIYELNAELKDLLEKESDLYKAATDNRQNIIQIDRGGKTIEVEEGELWEEVRLAGLDSEAGKTLVEKYPAVFEVAQKRDAKNKELHDFIKVQYGFDFHQMTLADYLKITESLIDYKLRNR